MNYIKKVLNRFETWFNSSFGWFFVNGRKQSEKFKEMYFKIKPPIAL